MAKTTKKKPVSGPSAADMKAALEAIAKKGGEAAAIARDALK